jgi:hypothetical protein
VPVSYGNPKLIPDEQRLSPPEFRRLRMRQIRQSALDGDKLIAICSQVIFWYVLVGLAEKFVEIYYKNSSTTTHETVWANLWCPSFDIAAMSAVQTLFDSIF